MTIPTKNTDVFYIENEMVRSRYTTEIYIPDEYLERSKASETGTTYKVLGILPYSVIVEGKIVYSDTIKIAQIISVNVSEKRKDLVKLSKYAENPSPVTVLLFQPGEPIMSEFTEANAETAEIVMDMLLGGNIPSSIPYWDVNALIQDCFRMNQMNMPIPSFIVEDIISVLYRSSTNPDNKFAYDIGRNPNINPLSYQAMSTRNVTRHISTFAGVTSEEMGQSLLYGIKRSKQGKEEPKSAIEKTIYA